MSPDVRKQIGQAAQSTVSIYKAQGLAGLISEVQTCYSKSKRSFGCLYRDLSARHIDQFFARNLGFPTHEFFERGQLQERMFLVAVSNGMSMNQINELLSAVDPIVEKAVIQSLIVQKP